MAQKVLVIKLGSAVITNANGNINKTVINKIVSDISRLSKEYKVVLVSSGAVSSGKKFVSNYKGTLLQRKVAAAIGNPILIQLYRTSFQKSGFTVAQALCERSHFSNRKQFLQLRDTFKTFWKHDVIPVVNENDVISDLELKFSDNDELATLLAIAFDAETLVLCTSVGGFLNEDKEIVRDIKAVNTDILSLVKKGEKSEFGLGGMLSKLTFTRLATNLGINVVMCGLQSATPISDALNKMSGTWFHSQKSNLKNRQKWLASGSITLGTIKLDKGASKAVAERKSLLTVGIASIEGSFASGEVVQLMGEQETIIGVAKTKLSSFEIKKQLKIKHVIAAHANDIVLI
ncbi:MAG TPA: glutamate 5-kinase [Niabella sp.]|nr:glutamate 5-kinase [Niabella sp.]HOZ97317.1 glutamate 5-kinase [Niabella sp.]HQW15412.1 glutamate 5-kinase [Niabella sp.]HQX20542.1 glutamate 5-kinase [Niabella sp.]HQX41074.1 glutamate 5-kinase [Niabella sp.]